MPSMLITRTCLILGPLAAWSRDPVKVVSSNIGVSSLMRCLSRRKVRSAILDGISRRAKVDRERTGDGEQERGLPVFANFIGANYRNGTYCYRQYCLWINIV